MRTTLTVSLLCLLSVSSLARAQDARERARQVVEEAEAHAREGRHALAAARYLDGYALMREAGMHNAPLALWSAGDQLAQIPGREQEAIGTIRRFLEESSTLADEAAQVRDWRSNALSLLDELEARVTRDEAVDDERSPGPTTEDSPSTAEGPQTTISPVGPVLLGVGGAMVVAGVIMGAVAFGQGQDLLARCPGGTGCDASLRGDEDAARTLAMVGDVFWISGAVAAAVGLVFTLVLTEESEPVTVSLGARGDGVTLFARGAF